MHESLSDIHSCISLIEQAAGLPVHPSAAMADLTFQLCNMGGEWCLLKGLSTTLGKP